MPTDGNTYTDGSTVTVLGNTGDMTNTRYTFAGWNTASDGSGTLEQSLDTTTAVIDKGLDTRHLKATRQDTIFGCIRFGHFQDS